MFNNIFKKTIRQSNKTPRLPKELRVFEKEDKLKSKSNKVSTDPVYLKNARVIDHFEVYKKMNESNNDTTSFNTFNSDDDILNKLGITNEHIVEVNEILKAEVDNILLSKKVNKQVFDNLTLEQTKYLLEQLEFFNNQYTKACNTHFFKYKAMFLFASLCISCNTYVNFFISFISNLVLCFVLYSLFHLIDCSSFSFIIFITIASVMETLIFYITRVLSRVFITKALVVTLASFYLSFAISSIICSKVLTFSITNIGSFNLLLLVVFVIRLFIIIYIKINIKKRGVRNVS